MYGKICCFYSYINGLLIIQEKWFCVFRAPSKLSDHEQKIPFSEQNYLKLLNIKYSILWTVCNSSGTGSKNEVMRTIGDFCNKNQRDYYDVSNNICQLLSKKTLIFQYACSLAVFPYVRYLVFQSRFKMINLPMIFFTKQHINQGGREDL